MLPDLRDCNNTALRMASRRVSNLFDDALAPVGLKSTQVSLLSEIARTQIRSEGIGPTLQDLAKALAVQVSAVTHALPPLIDVGLVELRPGERDRRTKHASLTPAGRRKLRQASQLRATADKRFETAFGATDAAALRALACRVASDEFLAAFNDSEP